MAVLNTTSKAINRLNQIIEQLAERAQYIDQQNSQLASHQHFLDKSLFSPQLFSTKSDKFSDYIQECKQKLALLRKCIQQQQNEYAVEILTIVEQQISALKSGLNANNAMHANQANAFKRRARKAPAYKKIAQKILSPIHELYDKLAETHEFERRLALMIAEREQQKMTANSVQNAQLNKEILALHQRLGRCRRAISKIEQDIERAEKPNSAIKR